MHVGEVGAELHLARFNTGNRVPAEDLHIHSLLLVIGAHLC